MPAGGSADQLERELPQAVCVVGVSPIGAPSPELEAATLLLVVSYESEVRAFFRDPDGHLLEISEAEC